MTESSTKTNRAPKRSKATNAKHLPKLSDYNDVRAKINRIRRGYDPDNQDADGKSAKLVQFEINTRASEAVIKDLADRGSFHRCGELGYYLDRQSRRLIDLNQAGTDLELILQRYGINPTEKLFKYVAADLFLNAVKQEDDSQIHHFSYFTHTEECEPILYIAAKDNYIWRITMSTQELVENGTDDVLFLTSKYTAPSDIPDRTIADNGLLESLITSKVPFSTVQITHDEAKFFLLCEIFGLVLREIIADTQPIYLFIGDAGSGKTTVARMIGRLLYGPEWDVTDVSSNVRDFDTKITSDHFVCFDNADENVRWFDTKLAIAATGGKIARNKLYKTHHLIDYPIIASIAITSRTPQFRRDDVADRLVILRTERFETQDHVNFDPHAERKVLENRNELWGELIYYLKRILRSYHEVEWGSLHVPEARLQGFARLTVIIARVMGIEETAYKGWQKMLACQQDFTYVDDPFLSVLSKWIAENQGREVTAGQLADELTQVAEDQGIIWLYKTGQSMGQKLRRMKKELTMRYGYTTRHNTNLNQAVHMFQSS